ncbi:MAG: AIDA repeat-containing protein [Desulfovibrio sp.]|nr:AIDA repeat-containing protein [Desulfovibrio sp.]
MQRQTPPHDASLSGNAQTILDSILVDQNADHSLSIPESRVLRIRRVSFIPTPNASLPIFRVSQTTVRPTGTQKKESVVQTTALLPSPVSATQTNKRASTFSWQGDQAYVASLGTLTANSFTQPTRYRKLYRVTNAAIIDAEKDSYHADATDDDNSCWAASTANMLAYTGWGAQGLGLSQSNTLEDTLFSYFTTNFAYGATRGGHQLLGLSWFFDGTYKQKGNADWDQPLAGGNTLGISATPYVSYSVVSTNTRYSNAITSLALMEKLATSLKNGDAVSLDINTNHGGHAITCWGYSYNPAVSSSSTSYYTGIFISDSDDDKDLENPQDAINYLPLTYSGKYYYNNFVAFYPSFSITGITTLAKMPDDLAKTVAKNTTKTLTQSSSGLAVSGSLILSQGGRATSATIYSGGLETVSRGGVDSAATIKAGGQQTVVGGSAVRVTIESGGMQSLRSQGKAVSTLVRSGGSLSIASGGYASAITASGFVDVLSGGTAINTTVKANGRFAVYAGGSASGGTVGSGAAFYVGSGARASNIRVEQGAVQYVAKGAIMAGSQTSAASGTIWWSGPSPSGYTGTILSASSDTETTLQSGATQYVLSQEKAVGTTIAAGGKQVVAGSTLSTTITAQGSQILSGGTATSTHIQSGGVLILRQNSLAKNTLVSAGGWLYTSGAATLSATTVQAEGRVDVRAKAQAIGVTVNANGRFAVYSGGLVRSATISQGAAFYLGQGASASAITLKSGAIQYIASGASVNGTKQTTSKGSMWWSGQSPFGYTGSLVNQAGYTVEGVEHCLGSSISATITGSAAVQYVGADGLSLSATIQSNGRQIVQSKGISVSALVRAHGSQIISSGGLASQTTVFSAGTQILSRGGSALATILSGGSARIHGTASTLRLRRGGSATVESNGVVLGANLTSGASLTIAKGGSALTPTLSSGATLLTRSGALVQSLVCRGGILSLASGTRITGTNTLTNTQVAATSLRVSSGARLNLGGNNTLTSCTVNAADATLSLTGAGNRLASLGITSKTRLTYSLGGLSPSTTPLLALTTSNTSPLSSANIACGAAQAIGTYTLATNLAHAAKASFTITQDTTILGTTNIGGKALSKNGMRYTVTTSGTTTQLGVSVVSGLLKKGTSAGETLQGTTNSDIFWGGAGNDTIVGSNGRDVVVYDANDWGRDVIQKTSGTMTLLFTDITKSALTSTLIGSTMTITKAADTSQSITINGWTNTTHSLVFGGTMTAWTQYARATNPSTQLTQSARNAVWQRTGLAT